MDAPAEAADNKLHAVAKFDVVTGAQAKSKPGAPTYTKVYGELLIQEAQDDDRIVAITGAMPLRHRYRPVRKSVP